MKNIKKEYQAFKPTEDDFIFDWIDMYKVINDDYDKYVYGLYGIAINSPDELKEYKDVKAFTFMEAVLFTTLVAMNIFRESHPDKFEIVSERYSRKLGKAVELHFLDTEIDFEEYIENRYEFYFHQLKGLLNGKLPTKIYSAFFHENFYPDPGLIPDHSNNEEVKNFNRHLKRMFEFTKKEVNELIK